MSFEDKQGVRKYIAKDLSLRVTAVETTKLVRYVQSITHSYPLPTVALGRVLSGTLLLAGRLKPGLQVGVLLKGNGPLGSLFAEANYEGEVRGVVGAPQYHPPEGSEFSVGRAMGNGFLSVTHHLPHQGTPQRGMVEFVSGEVGDDLAFYLHQSHQIRSVLAVGVSLGQENGVESAGGILIELMPGVEETVIEILTKNAEKIVSVSQMIKDQGMEATVSAYLKGIEFTELEHPYSIRYTCRCKKEKITEMLKLLGLAELDSIIKENEVLKINCEFCGTPYSVDIDTVKNVRAQTYKDSLN